MKTKIVDLKEYSSDEVGLLVQVVLIELLLIFAIANSATTTLTEATKGMHNDIVNKNGTTLPETGGIGTTMFYVIGAILVVGAAVVMITRKRMSR